MYISRFHKAVLKTVVLGCIGLCFTFNNRGQQPFDTGNTADHKLKAASRINPATLAMEFSLPLVTYPGRAGSSLPIALNYSSKIWRMRSHYYLSDIDSTYDTGVTSGVGSQANPFHTHTITPIDVLFSDQSNQGWSANSMRPARFDLPDGNSDIWYRWKESGFTFTNAVRRVRIILPDGSSHELRQNDRLYHCSGYSTNDTCDVDNWGSAVYLAVDGSGLKYDPTNGTLYLPDGARYLFNSSIEAGAYIDRFGNKTVFDNSAHTVTDTMGRTISDPTIVSAGTQTFSLPGLNGDNMSYTKTWQALKPSGCSTGSESECTGAGLETASDALYYIGSDTCSMDNVDNSVSSPRLFEPMTPDLNSFQDAGTYAYYIHSTEERICSSTSLFNPTLLTELTMSDGSKYEFRYNRYGEMTKIIYPTGAYERFRYDVVSSYANPTFSQAERGVVERWISEDGSTESQHWQYSKSGGTVTTIDPQNMKSVRKAYESSYSLSGLSDPKTGMAYEELLYSPPATEGVDSTRTLLRRELTEWTNTAPLQEAPQHTANATHGPRERYPLSTSPARVLH